MLSYLEINNIAIIKRAEISFCDGLNIFTGETGAGKSIIIDAIGLILGFKSSKDIIRSGEQKAFVSALFYPDDNAWKEIENLGIEKTEDNSLLIYREISVDGRGVCKINASLSTVAILKQLGALLINIHGQQETTMLYQSDKHIYFLDKWASKLISPVMCKYSSLLSDYTSVKHEIKQLEEFEQKRATEQDIIRYQIEELTALSLSRGEYETLEKRHYELKNMDKIASVVRSAYNSLVQSQTNVSDEIHGVSRNLSTVADFSDDMSEIYNEITDIAYRVDDIASKLARFDSEADENELNAVFERISEINKLCNKYKCNPDGLVDFLEGAKEKQEKLENLDDKLKELKGQLAKITTELSAYAEEISSIRKAEAKKLEKVLTEELNDLNMKGTQFEIAIAKSDKFLSNGYDIVEFLISPNVGEELKPLSKIASGGELSRIMLALKSIISGLDLAETYIFDEIDTGISGITAERVADKLVNVAKHNQTLIVTHSPHIAAIADNHFLIEKSSENGETQTRIKLLDFDGRANEIARINAGSNLTPVSIAQAVELLNKRKH